MSKTSTRTWDPAEHLLAEAGITGYLNAALEDGDSALVVAALGDVARVHGMSQLARETGLSPERLSEALSLHGNAEFATIMRVLSALGLRLHASVR